MRIWFVFEVIAHATIHMLLTATVTATVTPCYYFVLLGGKGHFSAHARVKLGELSWSLLNSLGETQNTSVLDPHILPTCKCTLVMSLAILSKGQGSAFSMHQHEICHSLPCTYREKRYIRMIIQGLRDVYLKAIWKFNRASTVTKLEHACICIDHNYVGFSSDGAAPCP